MARRRFEFRDTRSSKFWEVEVRTKLLHLNYGKIGTKGQSKTKEFETSTAAKAAMTKLITSKLKKGYCEAATATAAKAAKAKPSKAKPSKARPSKAKPAKAVGIEQPFFDYDHQWEKTVVLRINLSKLTLEVVRTMQINEDYLANGDSTANYKKEIEAATSEEEHTFKTFEALNEFYSDSVEALLDKCYEDIDSKDEFSEVLIDLNLHHSGSKPSRRTSATHKKIRAAIKSKAKKLDLGKMRSKELPEELWACTSLEELDLSESGLTEIPEKIGNLKNLRKLDLSSTKLVALPEAIGSLSKLKWLSLAYTPIEALPKSIGMLTRLQYLRMDYCELQTMPSEIGGLKSLKVLIACQTLTKLPKTIGALENLEELNLYGASILVLPKEIGALKKLRSLNLGKSKIKSLPKEIGTCEKLETLELAFSELKTVPVELAQLSNLSEYFSLEYAPNVPKKIRHLERDDLFDYLREHG